MSNHISRKAFVKGIVAGAVSLATLFMLQKVEYSINSSDQSAPAASEKAFTAGTYTASAKGIMSDVTVTMTFDDTSITEVKIDASGETPDIGGVIVDGMIEKILAAQDADVDVVSGATITSDAIIAAAKDCISQAQ